MTLISLYRSIKLQVVHKFLSNFTFYMEALPVIAQLHIPRNNSYLEGWGRSPLLPNWVAISSSVASHALLAAAGTGAARSLQSRSLTCHPVCSAPLPGRWETAHLLKLEGSGRQCLLPQAIAVGPWASHPTFQSLPKYIVKERKQR